MRSTRRATTRTGVDGPRVGCGAGAEVVDRGAGAEVVDRCSPPPLATPIAASSDASSAATTNGVRGASMGRSYQRPAGGSSALRPEPRG
jgi:hypothetical protein